MAQYNAQLGFFKGTAAELISGVRCVSINSSGNFQIAQASTATKMPAIAVAVNNIASGTVGKYYNAVDVVQVISGQVGNAIFVGNAGALVNASGSLLSGNVVQVVGAASTSGAYINI